MGHSVAALPWLPPAPDDVGARLRALSADTADLGATVQGLAGFGLKASQGAALGRRIQKLRTAGVSLAPLASFDLGVLASATFDLIVDAMPAAAARHGVALSTLTTPYDQVPQQALDPASIINSAPLDAVLLAIDHRWLGLDDLALFASEAEASEKAVAQLETVVSGLQRGGRDVILQTLACPPASLFGSADRRFAGTLRRVLQRVNDAIAALCEQPGAYLLDVGALAETVGTQTWFDPVQWAAYKLPFSSDYHAIYADHLGRLLGAIRGKSRKCLVLDLDNTLWGGVIGDDGIDGIKLGQGSALGEAFLDVQRTALNLRERGVILAVASKNNDHTAREPFQKHTEMLLKEHHIAVFQANWTDKASNIEAIAASLNIGLDAIVFLDDNAAERAQLRAALPMVAVPELPSDPNWYPFYLTSAGYFEAVAFSAEDRGRAESYASEARRAEVKSVSRDLGDYLAALEMVMSAAAFDAPGRQRIVQLINKTNQFNLTTRRYQESEVAEMSDDPAVFTLQVRLQDRFGDFGMIGVVICKPLEAEGPRAWDIDTWLMSCRVLGRQVEQGMLAEVVKAARASGVETLVGRYVPTAKNGMVADHYTKLGFVLTQELEDGRRHFSLDVKDFQESQLPFRRD